MGAGEVRPVHASSADEDDVCRGEEVVQRDLCQHTGADLVELVHRHLPVIERDGDLRAGSRPAAGEALHFDPFDVLGSPLPHPVEPQGLRP